MTWIFVYAAESGRVHAALDWAHKLVSPQTYECSLCLVTHGVWGEKQAWTDALGRLPGTKQFFHRDEFRRAFPDRPLEAPSVWLVDSGWQRVVGPDGWAAIDSVAALEADLHAFVSRRS